SMERAAALAMRYGVTLAAHPSYPDREHFGRRSIPMLPDELRRTVAAQCSALRRVSPQPIRHAKAHGALYHDLARDPTLTAAFLAGVSEGLEVPPPDLVILGSPKLVVGEATLLREGFADRGYDAFGHLLPRGAPGALLLDPMEAAAQARRLDASGHFDVLCVHGDTPNAVAVARAVRLALGLP
ncbi:MAG: LamB/YcsF family protein, partial [Myxococcales bacterium]|nr:LamB/YcsF family protein [Polyangiaceae bacterium]MDW8251953.1 LamB/YcsF family protein [Myxococcales bacterium]